MNLNRLKICAAVDNDVVNDDAIINNVDQDGNDDDICFVSDVVVDDNEIDNDYNNAEDENNACDDNIGDDVVYDDDDDLFRCPRGFGGDRCQESLGLTTEALGLILLCTLTGIMMIGMGALMCFGWR